MKWKQEVVKFCGDIFFPSQNFHGNESLCVVVLRYRGQFRFNQSSDCGFPCLLILIDMLSHIHPLGHNVTFYAVKMKFIYIHIWVRGTNITTCACSVKSVKFICDFFDVWTSLCAKLNHSHEFITWIIIELSNLHSTYVLQIYFICKGSLEYSSFAFRLNEPPLNFINLTEQVCALNNEGYQVSYAQILNIYGKLTYPAL